MTPTEERKLYAALRGPIVTGNLEDDCLRDAIALEDFDSVKPVVDEIVGKLEATSEQAFGILLEMCWNNSQAERRK